MAAQLGLDAEGGADRTDTVVLMGHRWEAEGRHHRRALVVHPELVHRALVLVQGLLHLPDQVVGLPQGARGDVIQVREPQEHHADMPQLRQPSGLAGVQAGQDRPGHIAPKRRPGRLAAGAHQRRRRWQWLDHGDTQA
jgi:hypothetical protein